MELAERTFLVTGGASGLGAATARRFAAAGGRVVVADIGEDAGRAVADQIGPAARFCRCDVADEASAAAAVAAAVEFGGALAGAICCAGVAAGARLVGKSGPHDLDLFARVIRVNLLGTFNVVRLAAAAMTGNAPNVEGERGVLVTTSSIAAWEGQIGQAAYAASKGGVAALTLPLARELGRWGVRIVSIAPGVFATAMVAGMPDEAQAALAAQPPFPQRLGRPEEFAALAQHVVENPMLNGCTIRLDGAMRMAAK